ncbi:MAG: hypothetical protein ABSC94_22705 [Polyangiaceae bacterium]|jgi:hypothetical protein
MNKMANANTKTIDRDADGKAQVHARMNKMANANTKTMIAILSMSFMGPSPTPLRKRGTSRLRGRATGRGVGQRPMGPFWNG